MDQGHPSRKLCVLARVDSQEGQQVYQETDETPKGHMRQTKQGVRSTKEKVIVQNENSEAVP